VDDTVLLVDYENVQGVNLSTVPPSVEVRIFIGASQARVPALLFQQAVGRTGITKVERIDGVASNALDFHIAFYLGQCLAERPKAKYVILSGDRGFDPLIRHVEGRGCHCRRITSLSHLDAHTPTAHDDKYKQVIAWLGKMEKKARPRKRKTLAAHIASHYQNKIPGADVEALIDRLLEERQVADTGSALTYHF
jgi:hypothetical protein